MKYENKNVSILQYKEKKVTLKYLEFARECIPTKAITIRDRDKPWFNSGIKRVMKIRDSLHKKCVNSRILITYANIRFKGIKLIT
jgi:hypothetical protein